MTSLSSRPCVLNSCVSRGYEAGEPGFVHMGHVLVVVVHVPQGDVRDEDFGQLVSIDEVLLEGRLVGDAAGVSFGVGDEGVVGGGREADAVLDHDEDGVDHDLVLFGRQEVAVDVRLDDRVHQVQVCPVREAAPERSVRRRQVVLHLREDVLRGLRLVDVAANLRREVHLHPVALEESCERVDRRELLRSAYRQVLLELEHLLPAHQAEAHERLRQGVEQAGHALVTSDDVVALEVVHHQSVDQLRAFYAVQDGRVEVLRVSDDAGLRLACLEQRGVLRFVEDCADDFVVAFVERLGRLRALQDREDVALAASVLALRGNQVEEAEAAGDVVVEAAADVREGFVVEVQTLLSGAYLDAVDFFEPFEERGAVLLDLEVVAVVLDELEAFGVGVVADEDDRPLRGETGFVVVRVVREVRRGAAGLLLVGVLEVFSVVLVFFVAVFCGRFFGLGRCGSFD